MDVFRIDNLKWLHRAAEHVEAAMRNYRLAMGGDPIAAARARGALLGRVEEMLLAVRHGGTLRQVDPPLPLATTDRNEESAC